MTSTAMLFLELLISRKMFYVAFSIVFLAIVASVRLIFCHNLNRNAFLKNHVIMFLNIV